MNKLTLIHVVLKYPNLILLIFTMTVFCLLMTGRNELLEYFLLGVAFTVQEPL